MDIESIGKGRESKHSYSSGRQSFLSLEALIEPRLSLRQRTSLIQIMDLQVSRTSKRNSGILMIQQNEAVIGARLSQQSRSNYQFRPAIQEKDLNRKSNFNIKHQCSCEAEQARCNGVHCICFLTPREICVIGQCCSACIELKNNFLKETRGWQLQSQRKEIQPNSEQQLLYLMKQKNCKNMHYLKQIYSNDPRMQKLIFCTCKKSHCQKKYCLCNERGVKCGQFCSCIDCANKDHSQYEPDQADQQKRWQRYATYQKQQEKPVQIVEDIGQFMHEQLQEAGQINQIMQFQPVNFDPLLQNI